MNTVDLGTIKYRSGQPAAKRRQFPKKIFVLLGMFFLALLFSLNPPAFLGGLLKPVSVFSQMVGGPRVKSDDGRTNLLFLGLDRRGHEGGLTDTILVVSLDFREKNAILISLPRDLWVSFINGKINSAYSLGGVELASATVEKVLGIPLHYFAVIDFTGFEKVIDILGGVTVDVETSFDDYFYPLPGKENDLCGRNPEEAAPLEASESAQFKFPCRFEHIHFEEGPQLMGGREALKFVRSRHAAGREGSDLARAGRQQKVALAAVNKALSLGFLVNPAKVQELLSTLNASIETNIGPLEAERLYSLGKDLGVENVKTVVLGGDFLLNPQDLSLYGHQWVLLPKAGDFSEIQAFVQRLLFGE